MAKLDNFLAGGLLGVCAALSLIWLYPKVASLLEKHPEPELRQCADCGHVFERGEISHMDGEMLHITLGYVPERYRNSVVKISWNEEEPNDQETP